MKVQELRQLLSSADRVCLEKAILECYKLLKKDQKEDFDPFLTDILTGKMIEKKKVEKEVNFSDLEQEIETFIENAYAQNYYAPNRVVPKSQRPKWRFMVKNFIKELDKIPLENENYEKAAKLLFDLYRLICYACNYYLFSTDDPFRSIGWDQTQLFALVVQKTFAAGCTREKMVQLLVSAVDSGLSRESLHIEQEMVLISQLNTADAQRMALEELEKLVKDKKKDLKGLTKYDNKRFHLETVINEMCGAVLTITVYLQEADKGIAFYFENSMERDKEIALYCALYRLDMMEEDDLWLKVYEMGIKQKIQPRDSLVRAYEYRKKASGLTRG